MTGAKRTFTPAALVELGTSLAHASPLSKPTSTNREPTHQRQATPAQLRAQRFPAGWMGPKIDAACRFVAHTGHTAAIGALNDAEAILASKAGTIIGTVSSPETVSKPVA